MANSDIEAIRKSTVGAIQSIAQQQDDDRQAVFDPRVKLGSGRGEQDELIVWSTKSVDLALKAIEEG
ncbi:MAG: hypothetical protein NC131_18205, partial [Roseburia sp.]|nr:hypothetical protein [Roseburia sp.]